MEHQGIEAQLSTAAKTQKQNQNEIKISSQADRWIEAKEDLPALIICIEEPEIYQHPIRARSFARVLVELSKKEKVQVFLVRK